MRDRTIVIAPKSPHGATLPIFAPHQSNFATTQKVKWRHTHFLGHHYIQSQSTPQSWFGQRQSLQTVNSAVRLRLQRSLRLLFPHLSSNDRTLTSIALHQRIALATRMSGTQTTQEFFQLSLMERVAVGQIHDKQSLVTVRSGLVCKSQQRDNNPQQNE